MADEEPFNGWARRIYNEAADKYGYAVGFVIFCLANHPDIMEEYNEYDRQMRATGLFVIVEEEED